MESTNIKVNTSSSISFGSLSWIVWIVFMILYYGTHTIFQDLPENIATFWVWFPFWLPFAISGVFIVIAIFCALIIAKLDD